ncbi:hypothetical protein AGABI1DRAFT_76892 [Agaricus bisporus var. burnettii JB137-S8]|uniref:FAD/NAD(P)-binding domain-containing protein n=1 Tax=Agaricus bisporus var. burnettii (strain JB137-S8 / ATCC MYA-4627 / FGSC 10392) TaxID=597362 RepID=K5XSD9_AGABU|nr:uncharacterized protein AGABI1DRAFT_76892 [Agaricus bisporus var. burnettii JB137-S8]EKM77860.1 hypothetical protein AGABI1DRAFT_76892 [Agaricus bisporus var. burnettii JB137-S8]
MIGHPSPHPSVIAEAWLSNFAQALQEKDAHAVSTCFVPDGWLRESHIFCWDNRTLQGRHDIDKHVSEGFPHRSFSNFELDTRPHLSPEHEAFGPQQEGIVSGFLFETNNQWGQGYFRLVIDEEGVWRALTVYMIALDIKGHEEPKGESGVYGDHMTHWSTISDSQRKSIEEDPQVLIIGAGQAGVNVAARFKQMNIPALVIDAHPRLGNTWRNRYNSLLLHTPRMYGQFLYQPYPTNWPYFCPKDKVANWIEFYVDSQDLVVWTSTKPAEDSRPVYDKETKRWTIVVDRAGERITIRPAHIICCMGPLGSRFTPEVKNRDVFKGTVIHGGEYTVPTPFAKKRVVVVGAGNTAGDICLDLSSSADNITMIQRSRTSLVPLAITNAIFDRSWPDDGSVPMEVADFLSSSMPFNLTRKYARIAKAGGGGESGAYAEMYKGLREKGMIVDTGIEGEGVVFQAFEKSAGYMLDVGFSKLVLSGRVKVKHGVEVASFKEESIILSDGSEIPADVVIFATGYHAIHDEIIKVFGYETAEKAGRLGGVDEEGERINTFRPTGHPALWYGGGSFYEARYQSKQVAMLIKASELGLRDA